MIAAGERAASPPPVAAPSPTPAAVPLLELRGVHQAYAGGDGRVEVLRGVSLRVAAGESVAIVGPSGSGKTTLLQLLGGLERAGRGEVLLDGRDLAGLDEDALCRVRRERVGFVFQSHHLLPRCSALENVLLPSLAERNRATREEVARARELLAAVGLAARLHHLPGQLSVGERQRVALARALLHAPALLLADEPTGALDRANAEALADLLLAQQAATGMALVVATHAPSLAARMTRVLRLTDGILSDDKATLTDDAEPDRARADPASAVGEHAG